MSLTKDDLQQIGTIIDESLEVKLEEKLESKLEPIKKDLKHLKTKVNKIDKTVSLIAKNYDEGDVKLDRRLTKLEKHLNLPQN